MSEPNILPAHEYDLISDYVKPGVTVLEAGDKRNPSGLYRDWYTARGAEYTCTDYNGRFGAKHADFRKPFDFGQFDLTTNFGVSEHVSVQEPFWANFYNATKPGGYMVGTTPKPKHWLHHGWSFWHPHREFFEQWAEANKMKVVRLIDCHLHNPEKHMIGYVIKRAKKAAHVWKPEFNALFWRNKNWAIPEDGSVQFGSL